MSNVQPVQRKICLLGDFAVGKTSLVRRLIYNKFEADYLATIGVHVSRKEVILGAGPASRVTLVLWDLAGGETFSALENSYYRGGAGALLVADVTRPETMDSLSTYATTYTQINPEAVLAMAFNKVDLVHDLTGQKVRAEELSARWRAPHFFTSALRGDAVEQAFRALAERLLESRRA